MRKRKCQRNVKDSMPLAGRRKPVDHAIRRIVKPTRAIDIFVCRLFSHKETECADNAAGIICRNYVASPGNDILT